MLYVKTGARPSNLNDLRVELKQIEGFSVRDGGQLRFSNPGQLFFIRGLTPCHLQIRVREALAGPSILQCGIVSAKDGYSDFDSDALDAFQARPPIIATPVSPHFLGITKKTISLQADA